jgi:hypothetical protein
VGGIGEEPVAQRLQAGASRRGDGRVAAERLRDALALHHLERDVELEHHRDRRREGRLTLGGEVAGFARSKYERGILARVFACQARSDRAIIAIAGADIHVFWTAVTTTSSPQPSISNGTPPSPDDPVDEIRASGAASWTAAAISSSGFITPVEVSLCVTSTARFNHVSARRASATCRRARGRAPLDVELRDVGAVGLRDLAKPVAERPMEMASTRRPGTGC